MKSLEDQLSRHKIEKEEKWDEYNTAMPFIPVLEDWEIRILPPFGGALMRFQLQKGKRHFSIYFDATGALGIMTSPYWEVYPMILKEVDENGNPIEDTMRYYQNEFREMIKDIYEQVETVEYLKEKIPEWYI